LIKSRKSFPSKLCRTNLTKMNMGTIPFKISYLSGKPEDLETL
jgi:hypothetical protein